MTELQKWAVTQRQAALAISRFDNLGMTVPIPAGWFSYRHKGHEATATLCCCGLLWAASRPAFHLQTVMPQLPRASCRKTVLVTGLGSPSGYFSPFGACFLDRLVWHLGWELSGCLGGLVSVSDSMEHSSMARIKSCSHYIFTENLFICGWPWMDAYFHNSGKVPYLFCIFTDFQVDLNLTVIESCLSTNVCKPKRWHSDKYMCTKVLYQTQTVRERSRERYKRSLVHIKMQYLHIINLEEPPSELHCCQVAEHCLGFSRYLNVCSL